MLKKTISHERYGPGVDADFLHTDNVTLAFWHIAAGTPVPEHAHPNEQICWKAISNSASDGETAVLSAGCVAVVPGNAVHSGVALTDCRVIDTFQPARTEFALQADD